MKYVVASIFFFNLISATAQFDMSIGHVYAATSFGKVDSANLQTYGVRGEWLVHERLGLNYNLEFVHRDDKIYQVHGSAGMLVGPPLIIFGLLNSVGESETSLGALGTVAGLILLVAPDGVSFHLPIRYHWDLSPYANVLGVDFMKNNNTDEHYLRYAQSYGVKVNYWSMSGFTLTAFTETRKVAGMGWSFGGGFGIGYAWE